MRISIVVAALGMLAATSCATQPPEDPLGWTRVDGQRITGNPALETQIAVDQTVCEGEMQKANLSGAQFCRGLLDCAIQADIRGQAVMTVAKGCMASRGYMLMPASQAEAYIVSKEAERAAATAPAPTRKATARK